MDCLSSEQDTLTGIDIDIVLKAVVDKAQLDGPFLVRRIFSRDMSHWCIACSVLNLMLGIFLPVYLWYVIKVP